MLYGLAKRSIRDGGCPEAEFEAAHPSILAYEQWEQTQAQEQPFQIIGMVVSKVDALNETLCGERLLILLSASGMSFVTLPDGI